MKKNKNRKKETQLKKLIHLLLYLQSKTDREIRVENHPTNVDFSACCIEFLHIIFREQEQRIIFNDQNYI